MRRLYLFSAEKAETTEKDALNPITERISAAAIEVHRALGPQKGEFACGRAFFSIDRGLLTRNNGDKLSIVPLARWVYELPGAAPQPPAFFGGTAAIWSA